MLRDLARDQGVADCLAKFAIDAKGFAELEKVYGHLPPDQFNAAVKARAEREFQQGGGIIDPLGVGSSARAPAKNPTVSARSPIPAGGTDPTFIRKQPTSVTFSREQLQNMPAETVHKTLTGRAPVPPTPTPAPVAPPARPAGGTAGTVPGRLNPLLAKR